MGELSNTTINGVSYDFKDAGAARQSHSHTKSQITDFPTSMPASDVSAWAKASSKPSYTASEVGGIPATEKGANNGVASLDSTGKVPSSQLPSYVDDVLEYSAKSSFPSTGETGKIYVDTSTNKTYRWSGSAYVEISESLALGETSSTAYRGDRGKAAYDHSQTTSGNPHNTTAADTGAVPNTSAGVSAAINLLSTGDSAPTDNDYYVSQYAGGGTSTTTYHRRPVSKLWEYIKSKLASKGSATQPVYFSNGVPVATTYTLGKSVPSDAKFTDTTYSAATTSAAGLMSAADKSKLDGIASGAQVNSITGVKGNSESSYRTGNVNLTAANIGAAASSHTHNYAGSSSAGGAATSANKLNTNAGSATQPVYFSNGVPVATTYSLGKSVPSNAKFTDTTYSAATTSAAGLMSAADKTKLNGLPNSPSEYTKFSTVTGSGVTSSNESGGFINYGHIVFVDDKIHVGSGASSLRLFSILLSSVNTYPSGAPLLPIPADVSSDKDSFIRSIPVYNSSGALYPGAYVDVSYVYYKSRSRLSYSATIWFSTAPTSDVYVLLKYSYLGQLPTTG